MGVGCVTQMEPAMISLKVLGTVAAIALVLPMAAPTASFAQNPYVGKAGVAARGAVPGGGVRSAGAPVARFNGGGGAPVARYNGGGYRGGYGGGYHHGGGGFIPGAVAGALVGGAIASQRYYGGPGYYAPGYYDQQYYDDGAVAVAPAGDDTAAYCMQTYPSYDPGSGTYLGGDGYRHLCP